MPEIYTKVINNIFDRNDVANYKNNKYDTAYMTRANMAKSRHLTETASGTKIAINLKRGTTLRHGDILCTNEILDKQTPLVIVKQLAEKVLVCSIDDKCNECITNFLLVAHAIGNMHRPIAIKNSHTIWFPIQDDSEQDTFKQKFSNVYSNIKIHTSDEIFVPNIGADIHGHHH